MVEQELQVGLEPHAGIMKFQDKFIDITPSGATIYVGIFDGKLVNFRWSEFEALATATQLQYPRELKTESKARRLEYFNSPEFKGSIVFNIIKNSTDGKAVDLDGNDIFDFDIITDRGDDRERPTQYAWKMGNYCEENTQKTHNIAAALCGDPITGKRFDQVVGGKLSDSICTSKIDHAVHIKESFDTEESEIKLDNYQLLDEPLYDESPSGTHPSDHSAICFDIICTTEQSPPETEIIDICGTLISWNAEGFCGVLPFLLFNEALQGFPREVREDFLAKKAEFENNNIEEMSTEVLIKKIKDFYTSMRPLLAGTVLGAGGALATVGWLAAAGVVAGSAVTAAGAEMLWSSVKPGGYWILDNWREYISRFNTKKCKILMIQELFLKDFLGMVEIRDNMEQIVQYIARYIIRILIGAEEGGAEEGGAEEGGAEEGGAEEGGAEEGGWRYQWDGYTGCVFWDSSVYELYDSLYIIRNKEAIEGHWPPQGSVPTGEFNHGGVWEHTKTKLEAGEEGDKFSTYFKFKLKVGARARPRFLNVTNIHLKASGGDHVSELRNILDKIRGNGRDGPKDHYLIGDFNDTDIEKLMINTSIKTATRDGWYKTMGKGTAQMVGNAGVAGITSLAQRLGFGWGSGGGKKRKSTRIKHKKTHKKSKRKKSYKKKRKTKRK